MSELTVIVLVAGVGSRLRPLTDTVPKCLAPVGDATILHRTLATLRAVGVGDVVLVTGYRDAQVREAAAPFGDRVRFAHSPRYAETQNVVSLACGLSAVPRGRAFAKLDGDLLLSAAVLERLLGAGSEGVVAVDRSAVLGHEEMKIELGPGGAITRFGKGLDPTRCDGESIGAELFRGESARVVREAIERAVREGREQLYYEDVYSDVCGAVDLRPMPVAAHEWIEIDDHEDLARATGLFAAAT